MERLRLAFRRVRRAIVWAACAYLAGLAAGIVLVHAGHAPTLAFRDRLVSRAEASSPALHRLSEGSRVSAAALDFAGNLAAGTLSAASGWWAPAALPVAAYRGWIGGIVSVDGRHRSRLGSPYYLVVVSLQLTGYILATGAGISLGLARKMWTIPKQAWRDAGCVYLAALPVFAIASAVEFLWTG